MQLLGVTEKELNKDVSHSNLSARSKSKKMVFSLKEDTEKDSEDITSSDEDDEEEDEVPELQKEDELIPVYEEDQRTGQKMVSRKLSYKMSFVDDRVGVRLNLNDNYFNEDAIACFSHHGRRLMKFVKGKDNSNIDQVPPP